MLTTADAGSVIQGQGQGVPDHKVLPISGVQHTQALCQWLRGVSVRQCATQCASLLHQGPSVGPW